MTERSRWFGVTVAALCLLLPSPAAAGGPQPSATEIHGTLAEIDGLRVLRVWGKPYERGFAQGYLQSREIVRLLNGFLASGVFGESPESYERTVLPLLDRMAIEPRYEAELKGILDGLKAGAGGPVGIRWLKRELRPADLLVVNCAGDFARLGCSSFAAWGSMTKDGRTLAGRNLDWSAIPALQRTQLIVVQAPSENGRTLGWVSVTWPGFIGCLTGMNSEGVTLSMHDADGRPPSVPNGFTPRSLALREAIETARRETAWEDIAGVLRTRVPIVGGNTQVTRPYADDGPACGVFEADGDLDLGGGVTLRWPENARDFLICTNHFRKRAAPTPCDRFARISKRLNRLADAKKTLDTKTAWDILGRVSASGGLTHHSVVFEPNARLMHVALSADGKPAPRCEVVTLEVTRLLTTDAGGGQ